jgi:hypothetical protein
MQGRVAAAIGRCADILPQLRAIGDSYAAGQVYSILTLSYLLHDDLAAGLAAAEQGYQVREAIGDWRGMVMAANQRALLLIALDRPAEARALTAGILARGDLTGDMYELGFALEKLAILQLLDGNTPAAQSTLRQALSLPAAGGDTKLRGDLRNDLVVALLMEGAADAARELLEEQGDSAGPWVELDRRLLGVILLLGRAEPAAVRAAAGDLAARARAVGFALYERKAHQIAAAEAPYDFPRLVWVAGAR